MVNREKELYQHMRGISAGVVITIAVTAALFVFNGDVLPAEAFLYETMPFYDYDSDGSVAAIFRLYDGEAATDETRTASTTVTATEGASPAFASAAGTEVLSGEDLEHGSVEVIGRDDIIYESGNNNPIIINEETAADLDVDALLAPYAAEDLDFEALRSLFYVSESNTVLYESDIQQALAFSADPGALTLTEREGGGPKALIFHTHSTEGFVDSDPADMYTGIVGVGAYLAEVLENKYGIETLHYTERFDYIDGKSQIQGGYDRMNPVIRKVLEENPTIEVVLDLHRDALPEGTDKLATEINGQPAARLMFVNGLSRLYENGSATALTSLPNANLSGNLAFSLNVQLAANALYPGLTRKIYLKAYRYSPHLAERALLVEVGADNNTLQEALNSMEPLADSLAAVLLD